MYKHVHFQVDQQSQNVLLPSHIIHGSVIPDVSLQVYPDKEITNIVESSELVTIDNWCGFNAQRCHQHNTHTVRPFRCLGEQSFPLIRRVLPFHRISRPITCVQCPIQSYPVWSKIRRPNFELIVQWLYLACFTCAVILVAVEKKQKKKHRAINLS